MGLQQFLRADQPGVLRQINVLDPGFITKIGARQAGSAPADGASNLLIPSVFLGIATDAADVLRCLPEPALVVQFKVSEARAADWPPTDAHQPSAILTKTRSRILPCRIPTMRFGLSLPMGRKTPFCAGTHGKFRAGFGCRFLPTNQLVNAY